MKWRKEQCCRIQTGTRALSSLPDGLPSTLCYPSPPSECWLMLLPTSLSLSLLNMCHRLIWRQKVPTRKSKGVPSALCRRKAGGRKIAPAGSQNSAWAGRGPGIVASILCLAGVLHTQLRHKRRAGVHISRGSVMTVDVSFLRSEVASKP